MLAGHFVKATDFQRKHLQLIFYVEIVLQTLNLPRPGACNVSNATLCIHYHYGISPARTASFLLILRSRKKIIVFQMRFNYEKHFVSVYCLQN